MLLTFHGGAHSSTLTASSVCDRLSLPFSLAAILQLKKRFLRKTNVIEALDQYQQLAKWLEKDGVHG